MSAQEGVAPLDVGEDMTKRRTSMADSGHLTSRSRGSNPHRPAGGNSSSNSRIQTAGSTRGQGSYTMEKRRSAMVDPAKVSNLTNALGSLQEQASMAGAVSGPSKTTRSRATKTLKAGLASARKKGSLFSVDSMRNGGVETEGRFWVSLLLKYTGVRLLLRNFYRYQATKMRQKRLRPQTRREKIAEFMEHPLSSSYAVVFHFVMSLLVIFSVLLICLETMDGPNQYHKSNPALDPNRVIIPIPARRPTLPTQEMYTDIETGINIAFSLEFLIRALCHSPFLRQAEEGQEKPFVRLLMNWFDLLALVPFYADRAGLIRLNDKDTSPFGVVIRVCRIFRILRLFRLIKHWTGARIIVITLKESAGPLKVPLFGFLVLVMMMSTLVYYVESCSTLDLLRNGKDECKFNDVLNAAYFMVTTMTSTGYGDFVPKTPLGKLVGSVGMVLGSLFLSIPLAIIGNEFQTAWNAETNRLTARTLQAATKLQQDDSRTTSDPLNSQNSPRGHVPEWSKQSILVVDAARIGNNPQDATKAKKSGHSLMTNQGRYTCARPHDFITDRWLAQTNSLNAMVETITELDLRTSFPDCTHQDIKRTIALAERTGKLLVRQHHRMVQDISGLQSSSATWVTLKEAVLKRRESIKRDMLAIKRGYDLQKRMSTIAIPKAPLLATSSTKRQSFVLNVAKRQQRRWEDFRRQIWFLMEVPESSWMASALNTLIKGVTFISCIIFLMESAPEFQAWGESTPLCRMAVHEYCTSNNVTFQTDPGCFLYKPHTVDYERKPLRFDCGPNEYNDSCFGQGFNFGSSEAEALTCRERQGPKNATLSRLIEDSRQPFGYAENAGIRSGICFRLECNTFRPDHGLVVSLENYWNYFEFVFGGVFSVEVLLRFIGAKSTVQFFMDGYAMVDTISVVPFYLELSRSLVYGYAINFAFVPGGMSAYKLGKLLQCFRLLKFTRYLEDMNLLVTTLRVCMRRLMVPLFVLYVLVQVFAAVFFFLEQGSACYIQSSGPSCFQNSNLGFREGKRVLVNDFKQPSKLPNILNAMWLTIVTVTTTGYGDVVPVTRVGKVVACMAMMVGTFYMALPLTLVGVQYYTCYQEQRERKAAQQSGSAMKNHSHLQLEPEEIQLLDILRKAKDELMDVGDIVQEIKAESQANLQLDQEHEANRDGVMQPQIEGGAEEMVNGEKPEGGKSNEQAGKGLEQESGGHPEGKGAANEEAAQKESNSAGGGDQEEKKEGDANQAKRTPLDEFLDDAYLTTILNDKPQSNDQDTARRNEGKERTARLSSVTMTGAPIRHLSIPELATDEGLNTGAGATQNVEAEQAAPHPPAQEHQADAVAAQLDRSSPAWMSEGYSGYETDALSSSSNDSNTSSAVGKIQVLCREALLHMQSYQTYHLQAARLIRIVRDAGVRVAETRQLSHIMASNSKS